MTFINRNIRKENIGFVIIYILGLLAIVALLMMDSIKQNENYHMFSDGSTIFGIPNFWNVISNVPIAIVGFLGLLKFNFKTHIQYFVLFLGVFLVALGSSFYHINPNSQSLIWDRLPMTIVFMTVCSIVMSEYIDDKVGRKVLIPILFVGILSVFYWSVTQDLRPYVFVQFYPMLAIPIIFFFFKSEYNQTYYYGLLLIAYILAKLLEHFDESVHQVLKVISGHSLKHIFSALGLSVLYLAYIKRVAKENLITSK